MKDSINIKRSTTHLDPTVVAQRVMSITSKLQQQLSLQTAWDDATTKLYFEANEGIAKGIKGTLEVNPGELKLHIDLPYLLRVQSKSLEEEIEKTFNEALQ